MRTDLNNFFGTAAQTIPVLLLALSVETVFLREIILKQQLVADQAAEAFRQMGEQERKDALRGLVISAIPRPSDLERPGFNAT